MKFNTKLKNKYLSDEKETIIMYSKELHTIQIIKVISAEIKYEVTGKGFFSSFENTVCMN